MPNDIAKSMLANTENLWDCFDELIESLQSVGDWNQKHGADWVFADVPYHLMYTDRDLVAGPIERSEKVPAEEQRVQHTIRELNAWNAAKFTERPDGQTPQDSVNQWRAMRTQGRQALTGLSDDQLSSPVWFPLVGCGWVPAMVSAAFAVAHTWSEFTQLRYHMDQALPEPSPDAVHGAVSFLQGLMPAFLDAEQAKGLQFTAVMEYTGPAGGSWTFRVADGRCEATEGHAANADIVLSQSPVTFELIRQGKLDPASAMESGLLKVQRVENMPRFGALFHPPALDQVIPAMGPGALG